MFAPLRRNVPVSLKLRKVNCTEALAAVATATGFPNLLLDRATTQALVSAPQSPEKLARAEARFRRLEELADFRWEGTLLAEVLREICDRYGLNGYWHGGTPLFHPQERTSTNGQHVDVSVFDDGRIRVYPQSITTSITRSRCFAGEMMGVEFHHHVDLMLVNLVCQFTGEDADRLAGIRNCVAIDERGNELTAQSEPEGLEFQFHGDLGVFPDEWHGRLAFRAPSIEARCLASLQGDLMVFEEYRPLRIEFPLPLADTRREVGPVSVEIIDLHSGDPLPDGDPIPKAPRVAGLRVKVRIRKSAGWYLTSLGAYNQLVPALYGVSGATFRLESPAGGMWGPRNRVATFETRFAPADDVPSRLVFDLVLKRRPAKLASFILQDIPLPGGG